MSLFRRSKNRSSKSEADTASSSTNYDSLFEFDVDFDDPSAIHEPVESQANAPIVDARRALPPRRVTAASIEAILQEPVGEVATDGDWQEEEDPLPTAISGYDGSIDFEQVAKDLDAADNAEHEEEQSTVDPSGSDKPAHRVVHPAFDFAASESNIDEVISASSDHQKASDTDESVPDESSVEPVAEDLTVNEETSLLVEPEQKNEDETDDAPPLPVPENVPAAEDLLAVAATETMDATAFEEPMEHEVAVITEQENESSVETVEPVLREDVATVADAASSESIPETKPKKSKPKKNRRARKHRRKSKVAPMIQEDVAQNDAKPKKEKKNTFSLFRKKEKKPDSVPDIPVDVSDQKHSSKDRKIPGFLSKLSPKQSELVGLSIAASALRVSIVKHNKVTFVAEHKLPNGVIVDGLLAKPEEFVEAVEQFWDEAEIPSKDVVFSINNRRMGMRYFETKEMPPDDLAALISRKQELAFKNTKNVDALITDYVTVTNNGRVGVYLAIAEKELISGFATALSEAGLRPAACELGPIAAVRSILFDGVDDEIEMVVDIGAEITTLTIVRDGRAIHFNSLNYGGNDFTRTLQTNMNLSWEEAENLKIRSGLAAKSADPTLMKESPQDFITAQRHLQELADRLTQELSSALRHIKKQLTIENVSTIRMAGGGSLLRGYPEQIRVFIDGGKSIESRELLAKEGFENPKFAEFTQAIGAACKQEFSLLPDRTHRSFQLTIGKASQDDKNAKAKEKAQKAAARRKKGSGHKTSSKNRQQSGLSPKLVGMLVGAAILAAMNFYSTSKVKPAVEDMKKQAPVQSAVREKPRMPVYAGPNSTPAANAVASALMLNPNAAAFNSITSVLKQANASGVNLIISSGNVIVVKGTLQDPAQKPILLQNLSSAAGVTKVEESKATTKATGGANFAFRINAPVDPGTGERK